jgi:hypothetical protein
MLSISEMEIPNTFQLLYFYLLEQEKATLVAEWTNNGRQTARLHLDVYERNDVRSPRRIEMK